MKKLNLGCGKDKREGYINLDISPNVSADVVCDIEEGLPFDDNSMEEVIAKDILTQISSGKNFLFVMNELWRITSKDGVVRVSVVNCKYPEAFQDPMSGMRFTDDSFTYLDEREYHWKTYDYGFKPWKVERVESKNEKIMCFNLYPCQKE
jgi:hypothetical protein